MLYQKTDLTNSHRRRHDGYIYSVTGLFISFPRGTFTFYMNAAVQSSTLIENKTETR